MFAKPSYQKIQFQKRLNLLFKRFYSPARHKVGGKVNNQTVNQDKNSFWKRSLTNFQKLGRSLIYPIALLPFAALLNRFGALGVQVANQLGHYHQADWWVATVIQTPGLEVFNNLPIIFALGTGFGWAVDNRGEAALVAGVFYLIISAFLGEHMLPHLFYGHVLTFTNAKTGAQFSKLFYLPTFNQAQQVTNQKYILDIGVFGGIFAGVFCAFLYNRFKSIKLPQALAFFGGRRFVPMLALACSIPIAFAFAILWPWMQYVLLQIGYLVSLNNSVAIPGSFFYGVVNRLLQPFGLHHILNTFLWFQLPIFGYKVNFLGHVTSTFTFVNGDVNAFNQGLESAGVFTSGYFPLFLGGEPAIALAMLLAIKDKERRRRVFGFLLGVGSVAFITGIDEPLVFLFIFISPMLWMVYAFGTGLFSALVTACHIHLGFGFSAGLIDYIISFAQSWGSSRYWANQHGALAGVFANPLMILPIAILFFITFFASFYWLIVKFDIKTIGRDDQQGAFKVDLSYLGDEKEDVKDHHIKPKKQQERNRYEQMGRKIYVGVGGYQNIKTLSNCATRLRFILKDVKIVNEKLIRSANPVGAANFLYLGDAGFQVIIGTDVESAYNVVAKLIANKQPLPNKVTAAHHEQQQKNQG